jgi:hypothetical protein
MDKETFLVFLSKLIDEYQFPNQKDGDVETIRSVECMLYFGNELEIWKLANDGDFHKVKEFATGKALIPFLVEWDEMEDGDGQNSK